MDDLEMQQVEFKDTFGSTDFYEEVKIIRLVKTANKKFVVLQINYTISTLNNLRVVLLTFSSLCTFEKTNQHSGYNKQLTRSKKNKQCPAYYILRFVLSPNIYLPQTIHSTENIIHISNNS